MRFNLSFKANLDGSGILGKRQNGFLFSMLPFYFIYVLVTISNSIEVCIFYTVIICSYIFFTRFMHSLKTTHHLVQSLIILNSTSQRVSHRQFLSRPQATEEIFRWKMQILFCFHFAEVNEVKSVNYTKTPIKKSKDKFSVDNSKTFMIWKKKIKG